MLVLGIDPGKKGGWVIAGDRFESGRMPLVEETREVDACFFSNLICENTFDLIVIEKIWAAAGWDHLKGEQRQMGPSSAFKMGDDFGQLKGVCRAFHQALALVAPQTWKNNVLGRRGATKQDAIDFVVKHMPWVDLMPGACRTPQDGIADAACLAQWGLWKLEREAPASVVSF